ncbi:rho GTPase-activating protein 4 isoform X5 [Trachypithecus francoisi]|uniref:rho GTPase-activating protein 4 isoform X5 n=1 Tax=Trachypithecus francoisi TaxID=54180 RepID=UPI00141AEF8F|nr:rho GTPase-activating protein 4 isoform X5 [Trachypithecus francoisi]
MAAHGKLRRERGLQAEYETQVKEMRWQLSEQLRCLELQGELRRELLQELAEFMRRRAEVELEYSRGLEKLAERFSSRGGRLGSSREHQSFRKEPSLLSPLHCWAVLLQHTRQQSRESAALSEVLAGPLAQRLSHIAEDVGRLVKKSRDLEQQLQDELLEVVSELQTAKKTYQAYHMESVNAEAKLREAERQEEKRAGRSVPTTTAAATEAGPLRKSSLKKGGRLVEKRQAKFMEHKLKCTKARNEYLLSLASVNAAVSNYYLHDVLDLMDCCDTGFHLALGQVLRSYTAAESRTQASQVQGLGSLEEAVEALDPPGDKAKVLEVHATIFCPPLRFDYHPHDGDEVAEIRVEMELQDEIVPRAQNIQSRLDRQTIETEEVNKTLKATLQALLEVVASDDGDVLDSFQTSPSTESLKSTSSDPGSRQAGRRRGQQQETETFYLTKLQEYLSGRSILAKLQAKHEKLQEALQRGDKEERDMSWTQYTQRKFQKSRHPRPSSQYNQRLFGGDMEKFIQSSGQPVPLVVESCIRFINLNGLQHEGIFRVSGAQLRVSEIRDAFERGEDPLVEGCTAHDLDSVAGVLKLYFRSLEPPLFPPDLFSELLASSELEATAERVEHVSRLLWRLPAPVLVVLRYLFTFLNHLAQYSDENMMDPYNLAVCFGPTLLPVPAGQDPVALQGRVNQLVQTLILQPDRVFPPLTSLPGPVYEKCMAPPSASCLGDAQLESLGADNEPELEAEMLAQEDDLEGVMEAVACFAYTGRTAQELSFRRGDVLRLHERASSDWWRGEHNGVRGLIPHKYITLPEGAEKQVVGAGPQTAGESGAVPRASWHQSWFTARAMHLTRGRGTLWTQTTLLGPASPEQHVEVDKAVAQNMDSVFKELLGKTSVRQCLGPASAPSPSPGPRSPKAPASSRLGRNKGFSRGPGPQPHPQHPTPRAWTRPPSHTEVLLLELCAPGGYPLDRPLSPALLLLSNPVQQVQGACTSPCAEVGWGRTRRDAHSTPCLPLSPGPGPFWRLGKALFCDFVEGWSVAAGC